VILAGQWSKNQGSSQMEKSRITYSQFLDLIGEHKVIKKIQDDIYRQWNNRSDCDDEYKDFLEECLLVLQGVLTKNAVDARKEYKGQADGT